MSYCLKDEVEFIGHLKVGVSNAKEVKDIIKAKRKITEHTYKIMITWNLLLSPIIFNKSWISICFVEEF